MSEVWESDSDVDVWEEWESSDDSNDEFIAPLTDPTSTAGEAAAADCSKVVKMWTIKNAEQFLSPHGLRETFDFEVQHTAYPNVVWTVSLHPPKIEGALVSTDSLFAHFVRFPSARPSYCVTSVTAELVLMADERPGEEKDLAERDVIGVVRTGRNTMDARKVTFVTRRAWPLSVLQTAAANDGSLHIRLTLKIDFEIERAIRSRDLLQGLLKSGIGSDFTIRVGDEQFAVHRAVLSTASGDLNDLFIEERNNVAMLDLTGVVSAAGMKTFLALIYRDTSYDWITKSDVAVVVSDVLLLAGRFKTHQSMDQIGALVQKSIRLDNVLRILEVACIDNAPSIEAICYDFIFANRAGAQSPEFMAKLQEVITNDKVRRAILHAVLNRRCCSTSCRCARRGTNHEVDDIAESFPNEPILFARTLEIFGARSLLSERRYLRYAVDHSALLHPSSEGFEWKIALQPVSDLPNERQTSFAAIFVWLESVPASHSDCQCKPRGSGSYWAYVDLCLESGGACRNEKWRYESGVPFEFKPSGKRVLFIAEAWSMAALHEAIRDDTLRIKVDLRLVKLPEFLRCHEIMLRAQEADRAVEGLERITVGDVAKSGSDCLKSIQTLFIDDASHRIATLAKLPSLHFSFDVAHPAFAGFGLCAFLLPRGEIPWLSHFSVLKVEAKFHNFSAHCVTRCCLGITAELVKLPRKALDDGSHQQELFEIVELGPVEMIHRPGHNTVALTAWPFQVLKSAINPEDDTLCVRFILTIFSIEQAFGMHASIRELRRSGRSSDFTITAGGQTFLVHKCVLSAASVELKAIVSDATHGGVLDLTDFSSVAGVDAFLALAYCDTFDWLCQDDVTGVVCNVLALAERFGAEQIKDQIVPAIVKILSSENVLRIFDAAVKFDASKAKDACFRFLLKNGAAVQQDELLFAQLQGHSYVPSSNSKLQPQREFAPDADTIFVSSKKASAKRSRSIMPISDDDTSNFEDKSSLETKNMYQSECKIKKVLRVDNYDLDGALRVLGQLLRKSADQCWPPLSSSAQQISTAATAASNGPTISSSMDFADGAIIPPAVSNADEITAQVSGPQEETPSSAAGFGAPRPITRMDCTDHTEAGESAQSMEIVAHTPEAMATQLQSGGADLLSQENAGKARSILGDFLLAFFQRHMCCSRTCDLSATPRSTLLQGNEFKATLPTIKEKFSISWTFKNASEMLNRPKLVSYNSVYYLNPQTTSFTFRSTLYPKGVSLAAQHDEFASLALGVTVDWESAQSELPDYFWAEIELNLVGEGLGGVVQGSTLWMPFRFSKNCRKVLLLDKAWPTAVLRNAIWRSDNTLHIKVKVTIVNIPEVLNRFDFIRRVYEKRAFTDFILSCRGETVKVHKSILAQRSEIFAAMFSSEMREAAENSLDLTDSTTPSGLSAFVDAIYFGEINCSDGDVAMDLVKLAHRYEVNDVKSACDQQLARVVDMENVVEILAACDLYALPVSNAACMRFLAANRLEFLKSPRWRELTAQANTDLLQILAKEVILHLGSSSKTQEDTVRR